MSSDVRIWKKWPWYVLNNSGTFVGHSNKDLVINQYNVIEAAKTDGSNKELAKLTQEKFFLERQDMVNILDGQERVASFRL